MKYCRTLVLSTKLNLREIQNELVSYQLTISRIQSITYFDTPAAAVHHLKAEKVHCVERDYVLYMHLKSHSQLRSVYAYMYVEGQLGDYHQSL